jgi:peptidyl-prolyl cis-trans isomerase B (cyclophilin B)
MRAIKLTVLALGAVLCAQGGAVASATPASGGAKPAAGPAQCVYTKDGTKPARDVGIPSYDPNRAGPFDAVLHTNQGDLGLHALTTEAPCTTYSFRYLALHKFYDDTPCHRLVTSRIYVLQCGDPTGTGDGGPGYSFPDENLTGATYPAGTIAMANSGPNTNGSQFFFVYQDTKLAPKYTPFAKLTSGLDVLRTIAAAGDDGSNGPGDGHPKAKVQIQQATLTRGGN